jgi:tRNA(adenine34) deaminase
MNCERREAAMTERKKNDRRWSHKVKTVSTFPPAGIFTKDAETIARSLASKKVSPKGIGSGIRMVQFFINRAGKNLTSARKKELEKAKQIMQAMKDRR